jgi:PKD repeat protein
VIISFFSLIGCLKEDEASPPVASFTMDKSSATVDEIINFTNASQNATSYVWNFGDGNSSTDVNPSHAYSSEGTYAVILTASGEGGTDASSSTINISYPPAVANFEVDDTTAFVNQTITFSNTSEYGESYSWDFGDGNSSTDENPDHSYAEIGTYTVELTVTGQGGDTNSKSQTITVYNIEPGEKIGPFVLGDDLETYLSHMISETIYHYPSESNGEYNHLIFSYEDGIGFFITSNSSDLYYSDIPRAIYAFEPYDCLTELGITIGSTLSETEAAYGTPDNTRNDGSLSYANTLGISFWSDDTETLVEDIYIAEPTNSARLSFKIDFEYAVKNMRNSGNVEILNISDLH